MNKHGLKVVTHKEKTEVTGTSVTYFSPCVAIEYKGKPLLTYHSGLVSGVIDKYRLRSQSVELDVVRQLICDLPDALGVDFLDLDDDQPKTVADWALLIAEQWLYYLETPQGSCWNCGEFPVELHPIEQTPANGHDWEIFCPNCKHHDRGDRSPLYDAAVVTPECLKSWFSYERLMHRVRIYTQQGLTGNPVAALRKLDHLTHYRSLDDVVKREDDGEA